MSKYFSDDDIGNLVAHHPPSGPEIIQAHEQMRASFHYLMVQMNNLLPEGDLKIIAIHKAHEALQAANTCIAVEQRIYKSEAEQYIVKHGPDDAHDSGFHITKEAQPAKLRCEVCNGLVDRSPSGNLVHCYAKDMTHDPVV